MTNFSIADKIKCWVVIITHLLSNLFSIITAPFIYPIWYVFRKQISRKVYTGTSWEEIKTLIYASKPKEAKQKLCANGYWYYWLWTYGELSDPTGEGEMPLEYGETFWDRYNWNALRNPRFNLNHIAFRTGKIVLTEVVKDTRNLHYWHKSFGISDSPDGVYYAWMKDTEGKSYFVYEKNTKRRIFYFGYIGFNASEAGRFETSYRKTEGSYNK